MPEAVLEVEEEASLYTFLDMPFSSRGESEGWDLFVFRRERERACARERTRIRPHTTHVLYMLYSSIVFCTLSPLVF